MNNDWTPPTESNPPAETTAPPPPPVAPPAGSPPPPGGFGAAPPPPPPPPTPPAPMPGGDEPAAQPPPGGSKGRRIAALVSVAAVIAAAVFAVTWMSGGGEASQAGAETPVELGERVLDAFDDRDVLGAVDLLLPGERATLRQPLVDTVDELERLEILDGMDLSGLPGVGVELSDHEVEVSETNADDVVHIMVSGTADLEVDPTELPVGRMITQWVDELGGDLDVEPATTQERIELPLVGVEQDGEWYLSIGFMAAEAARLQTWDAETGGPVPIPAEGIIPAGGDSPEQAVELAIAAATELDAEALLSIWDPNEAAAAQRYAPLFLDDIEAMVAELDMENQLDIEIGDLDLRVEGSGDRREVYVDAVSMTVTMEPGSAAEQQLQIDVTDDCVSMQAEGMSEEFCFDEGFADGLEEIERELEGEAGGDELLALVDTLAEIFEGFEPPGMVVTEVDGQWYVSPFGTMWEGGLAVLRAFDPSDLDDLAGLIREFVESADFLGAGGDWSQGGPVEVPDGIDDDWFDTDDGADRGD